MTRARTLALAVALGLVPAPAAAHTPEDATARVTLRDEHVEVVAEWDLFRLVAQSPTEVATATEDDLVRLHRELVTAVERETQLTVDGAPRRLEVRGFPTPPELRALAATLSASGHDHGARARIRLEAPDAVRDAKAVALACPSRLGAVNASFVQPTHRFVANGEPAVFAVLAAPARTSTSSGEAPRDAHDASARDASSHDPSRLGAPAPTSSNPGALTCAGFGALGLFAGVTLATLFGRRPRGGENT